MSQPPELQSSLRGALDTIATRGHELLQQNDGASKVYSFSSPGSHGATSQLLRKGLMEAATKLVQLLTQPEEYLEKLANSVSFTSSESTTRVSH